MSAISLLNGSNPSKIVLVPSYFYVPQEIGASVGFYLVPDDFEAKINRLGSSIGIEKIRSQYREMHEKMIDAFGIRQVTVRLENGPVACQVHFAAKDLPTVVWCQARKMWLTYREWEMVVPRI